MKSRYYPCFLIIVALAVCSAGALQAETRVSGGAAGPGGSCGGQFLFDSGAGVTILSRDCARLLGLLTAAGAPAGNTGEVDVAGTTSKLWCYNNISVAAISSAGQNCVNTGTVYVSQKAGDYVDDNILGQPWQKAVDACYRAKDESTSWPWTPPPPPAPRKEGIRKIDIPSGDEKCVLEGFLLNGSSASRSVDMVFFSGSAYSFIPQSIAASMGPVTGSIDLAVADPGLFNRIRANSMDPTLQSVFGTVTINSFDMGFGTVNGPFTLLVSQDANSNFGIMGDSLVQAPTGSVLYGAGLGTCGAFIHDTSVVPEPSSLLLLLAAAPAFALRRRTGKRPAGSNRHP